MQYFKIGRLVSVKGLQGEIVLQHNLGKKSGLKAVEAIFIEERKERFMPYFVQSALAKSIHETILKLEGITNPELARKLLAKDAWLQQTDFEQQVTKQAPISLLGFTLYNENEPIGEITEVIEQPHQLICSVLYNNEEALVPVHENNLQKIDRKARKVFVIVPDGLLDIYSTGAKDK